MSRFPDRFPQHDHLLDRGRPFGIDPVHFGIIYPRRGGRLESILVFYIPMVIVLFLVTFIPALSLWLPHLVLN